MHALLLRTLRISRSGNTAARNTNICTRLEPLYRRRSSCTPSRYHIDTCHAFTAVLCIGPLGPSIRCAWFAFALCFRLGIYLKVSTAKRVHRSPGSMFYDSMAVRLLLLLLFCVLYGCTHNVTYFFTFHLHEPYP